MNIKKNKFLFWLLWILSFGIPFTIIIFPFYEKNIGPIIAWGDILDVVYPMIIPSCLLGFLLSVFQYFLVKFKFNGTQRWFFFTLIGYSFAPIFSVILIICINGILYPDTLTTGGESFQFFPRPLSMILTGFLTGVVQKREIQNIFTGKSQKNIGLLWILLSALAWSLSFVVSTMFIGELRLQSMFTGLTIGFVSGILFIIADK